MLTIFTNASIFRPQENKGLCVVQTSHYLELGCSRGIGLSAKTEDIQFFVQEEMAINLLSSVN